MFLTKSALMPVKYLPDASWNHFTFSVFCVPPPHLTKKCLWIVQDSALLFFVIPCTFYTEHLLFALGYLQYCWSANCPMTFTVDVTIQLLLSEYETARYSYATIFLQCIVCIQCTALTVLFILNQLPVKTLTLPSFPTNLNYVNNRHTFWVRSCPHEGLTGLRCAHTARPVLASPWSSSTPEHRLCRPYWWNTPQRDRAFVPHYNCLSR